VKSIFFLISRLIQLRRHCEHLLLEKKTKIYNCLKFQASWKLLNSRLDCTQGASW